MKLSKLATAVAVVGRGVTLVGALAASIGAVEPWGQFTALHSWHVALPGVLFGTGLAALVAAIASMRYPRVAVLTLVLAIVAIVATSKADYDVPIAVRGQLLSLQASLIPVNRLLDQFHIQDIEAGNFGERLDAYVGPGLALTRQGAFAMLVGAILALPGDPLILAGLYRFGKGTCRNCGTRTPYRRNAHHCPSCGYSLDGTRSCPSCHAPAQPTDRHCIDCGTGLTAD